MLRDHTQTFRLSLVISVLSDAGVSSHILIYFTAFITSDV